jgi:outer membrane protein assembly factor BamB
MRPCNVTNFQQSIFKNIDTACEKICDVTYGAVIVCVMVYRVSGGTKLLILNLDTEGVKWSASRYV